MARDKVLFFILSVVVVAGLVAFGLNLLKPGSVTGLFSNQNEISGKVEKLYELVNAGVDVSVVKVEEANGMYKLLLKAVDASGAITYREVYVSMDGGLMSENMILVSDSINRMTKMRDFVDCMDGKGMRIFGLVNHTATSFQFNALGGSYATKLYGSCDGGERAQQCIDAGITQVPTTVYQGKGYPGVQTAEALSALTGCMLS